jgi:preprotein translocase subunit SecG
MLQWFDYIFMVLSIIIIILCLLQGGKSEGASGAITGGGLNVFVKTKERGSERVVSIITYVLVIIFFIFATLILALGYVPAA